MKSKQNSKHFYIKNTTVKYVILRFEYYIKFFTTFGCVKSFPNFNNLIMQCF